MIAEWIEGWLIGIGYEGDALALSRALVDTFYMLPKDEKLFLEMWESARES